MKKFIENHKHDLEGILIHMNGLHPNLYIAVWGNASSFQWNAFDQSTRFHDDSRPTFMMEGVRGGSNSWTIERVATRMISEFSRPTS